tara:strand:- start:280 stop:489 length:210 start_codon:yes stop_codon:yes gene_type:complete
VKKNKFIILLFCLILTPQAAFAYIGPGLALGTIILTIAIILVLLLSLIAVLYYPIKKMIKKIKLKKLKK